MGDILEIRPASSNAENVNTLKNFLALNPSIEFIRIQWLDYAGVNHARVATTSFAISLAEKNQPITMPAGLQHFSVIDGSLLFEDLDIGHDEIWAEWSGLKVCYYCPGHASVLCVIKECSPNTGKGWRRCPRSRLAEIVNSTKSQHDLDFLFGMEIEFYIMDESSGSPQPVKMVHANWSTASLNNKYVLVVEEIVRAIINAGIPVRQ